MSNDYQINSLEMYDAIRYNYMEVYSRAVDAELPTDNIQIHLRSNLKDALEMGDTLLVGFGGFERNVSVTIDDTIGERMTPNGELKSYIYIYDPTWPNAIMPEIK